MLVWNKNILIRFVHFCPNTWQQQKILFWNLPQIDTLALAMLSSFRWLPQYLLVLGFKVHVELEPSIIIKSSVHALPVCAKAIVKSSLLTLSSKLASEGQSEYFAQQNPFSCLIKFRYDLII